MANILKIATAYLFSLREICFKLQQKLIANFVSTLKFMSKTFQYF